MDSKVVRADFGSGLTTLANQILARTFFRFRRDFVCVPSRWKVLSGEFRRRPTSLAVKLRKSDPVGRRGLFEPREDFSRLNTYAIPLFDSVAVSVADFSAQNLQLISLPTSQGQQRTHIQAQPASGD